MESEISPDTEQNTDGSCPVLVTMADTEALEGQSLLDSMKLSSSIPPISHTATDSTTTLGAFLGSESMNQVLVSQSFNMDSSESPVVVMLESVGKDVDNPCLDAMCVETREIDSVVSSSCEGSGSSSSSSFQEDDDNNSVVPQPVFGPSVRKTSPKGNNYGDDGEEDIDGKTSYSPMQIGCKSSSCEHNQTEDVDDGEGVNYRSYDNPYYDDYCHDRYRARRFNPRFVNTYHPSFNGGNWGRAHRFPYSPWHEHCSSREEGDCRENWRHEPPGFSLPILKAEPTGLGAGLSNLGNTCFINAILQCFTHSVPLVKALRSSTHVSPCKGACDGFCVLCALLEHIDLSLKSSGKVLSPSKFVDNLNHISSCFQRYQQEDAHEFLQCLLDRLERCCLNTGSNGESSSSQDDNMVQQVFGGRLVSKLRCCNCGQCSDKYEPLVDLSLEIENANTLQNALESFTKVETIDDPETKFTCENCKEEVSREKQLMIDQLPLVATFHLKRFKSDGSSVQKIGKHVEFPLELDLKPYTNSSADSEMELKYQLYAIVVHNGFLPTSGHYFCYIRSSPETWHKMDDSAVVKLDEEFLLSQAAYILFYAKDGTPWFSNMMEMEQLCVDSSISNTSPKSVLENVDGESTSYQNGAATAANIDNCEAAATRDAVEPMLEGIQIRDTTDADEVEPMLEGIQISDTRDADKGISSDISGEYEQSGRNLGCDKSRVDAPGGTPHVATNCSNAVLIDDKISVKEVLGCKGNDNCRETNGIEKDIFHPTTSSKYATHGNSHGKPEPRCGIPRDHLKVENRVNCKRSPGKGARKSERREAVRFLKNMPNSSRRKGFMALLPRSDKKKRSRISPHKKASPTGSRRKLLHQLNDESEERHGRICRESKHFDTVKRTCLFQGA